MGAQGSPRQVTLAFLVRRPSLFTIPKASRLPHVEENAGAGDLHLTDEEVARIAEAYPLPAARPGHLPVI